MGRKAFLDALEPGAELDYLMAVLTEGDVGVLNPQSAESLHDDCRLSREEVDAMLDELSQPPASPPAREAPPAVGSGQFWAGELSLSSEELDILARKAD